MNSGILLSALAGVSVLTSLTVEGIKKILVEQGKTYSLDEVREHLGLPPRKEDPEEETLRRAMFRAKRHLDIYCRERELNEIRRKMGITEHAIPDVSGENETVKNSENL